MPPSCAVATAWPALAPARTDASRGKEKKGRERAGLNGRCATAATLKGQQVDVWQALRGLARRWGDTLAVLCRGQREKQEQTAACGQLVLSECAARVDARAGLKLLARNRSVFCFRFAARLGFECVACLGQTIARRFFLRSASGDTSPQ